MPVDHIELEGKRQDKPFSYIVYFKTTVSAREAVWHFIDLYNELLHQMAPEERALLPIITYLT